MFWANGHALLAEECAGKAKIWIAGLCFALEASKSKFTVCLLDVDYYSLYPFINAFLSVC